MEPIKTVFINNQPWFCVSDVCNVYKWGASYDVIKKLNINEKQKIETWVITGAKSTGELAKQKLCMWFVNTEGFDKIRKIKQKNKSHNEEIAQIKELIKMQNEILQKLFKGEQKHEQRNYSG